MRWGTTELIGVAVFVALVVVVLASIADCNRNRESGKNIVYTQLPSATSSVTATLGPTAIPTRSSAELIATAQAKRTATAEALLATLDKCEETAAEAKNVTAESLNSHQVTVSISSGDVVDENATNASDERQDVEAEKFLIETCFPLLSRASDEHPHLLALKRAKKKASDLVEATVAPLRTATARAHATTVARNATVVSRGVTFKCERLRLAQRESSIFPEIVYQHVANIMQNAPQAEDVFFDSYDAKVALEQCP